MRASILGWCFLLFSQVLWGGDAVKDFAQDLSKDQKALMSEFLLTITESSGGYVLFGDKPMSIETVDLSSLKVLTIPNPRTIALVKGRELWQDLNLTSDKKEYVLKVFDVDSNCHFVCINRKAFLQTVADNLSLFRYALGPAVTPENLLNELVASSNPFQKVLKNDRAILEILLGCGKQNAIVHSRVVNISDPATLGQTEEFPFISKKLCKAWAASSKKFTKQQPSFGFQSLNDEESVLNKLIVNSEKLKPFSSCQLPSFDCDPDSEETRALLNVYEQARAKILKATTSKTFLEETLRKFFANSNGTMEVPAIPKIKELCLPVSREEIAKSLVEIVHKRINAEPYNSKKFKNDFLQGVIAREKGKQMPVPIQMKRFNDIATLQKDLEACSNLDRANAYFNHLSTRKDLVALLPKEIYYKTLKPGKEGVASSKTNKVSFQYSFQILGDPKSKDWGIVKQENLAALIPGVAYAIIGMHQGEERVVYIHPRHAYGEDTFYSPNISIVAQIRLLDFAEGEQPVAIHPAHRLEQGDYKDLLAKFEVLRGSEYFDEGVEFWDSIKKSGNLIDFQTFQKLYNAQPQAQSSFSSAKQEEKFMVDLQYQLLSLQRKN
ncbi:MAG TPA: FKBP-type peptidyl-prolyl cis-trans isomerase [Chlamydiales bacterium]|nr:FKBP-type peptidyl-prolyl cis-trans isomerase [Chlamydiales bacterium]